MDAPLSVHTGMKPQTSTATVLVPSLPPFCHACSVLCEPGHSFVCAQRCEATDIHRDNTRTIDTSHYHAPLGVDVPPREITTSWTQDLRRFDNVISALWVLYQVRVCWHLNYGWTMPVLWFEIPPAYCSKLRVMYQVRVLACQ